MKNLEIILDKNKQQYHPSERLIGKVRWQFEAKAPKALNLKFYWQTSGRSQSDAEIIKIIKIENIDISGSKEFEFTFPYGPPSYEGKLFSLNWFLELYSDSKGIQTEVIELELQNRA